MATFKVLHFKRCTLLGKQPSGYIFTLLGTNAHLYTLWGGSNTNGYTLTDWGAYNTNVFIKEYEDGFTSSVLISNLNNVQTVTTLSESNLTYNATLDINHVLVGVTPTSIDAGITQTSTGGGTGAFSISAESYKAYARRLGWLLSGSASLAIVCVDPLLSFNFGSYAMIANYAEITMAPNVTPTEVDITTARVQSRVRWGDAGSALCQEIIAEDDSTNSAGYQDLVMTPGQIGGACTFDDRVVVLKNESIYEMLFTGYPNIFETSLVVPDNGTTFVRSVAKTGKKTFFFAGNDSFYIYGSGEELQDIGKNIKERFYGYNSEYTFEDLQKIVVQVFDDRRELWLWIPTKLGVANSEVYKFKDGAWTMTDYYNYGHGNLAYLGKEYYQSSATASKTWVPILFFDEVNITTAASDDYVGKNKASITAYKDLQTGNSTNTSVFETKDFPLELGSRVSEFKIQAKTLTTPYGEFDIQYSVDEGQTWSTAVGVKVRPTPALEFYGFTFDVTAESIRFKISTTSDMSFGKSMVTLSQRKREALD